MNSISDIFDQYAQVKPKIMTMPYKESFELALCKTGFSIYRINLGKEWDNNISRPENHYITSPGEINLFINPKLFLVPCSAYPKDTVMKIAEVFKVPTIQIDWDGNYKEEPPFGWAKGISENDQNFVTYWKDLINNYTRLA